MTWRRWIKSEEGQDLLEYGLLVSLIAVFALGVVGLLGQHLNVFFWSVIGNSI
jgi:Flp pilus assembly pilin Flp